MPDYSLQNSIEFCRQLTLRSRSSFAPAFSLLPRAKREAMEILYAYNRFTDDLVDLPDVDRQTGAPIPTSPRRRRQKLNQWVKALETIFGAIGEPAPRIGDPNDREAFAALETEFPGCKGLMILPALKMIVDRFNIPAEPFFHLIDGMDSDIEPRQIETFDESSDYCHQVATSVGFASLSIWGTTQPLYSEEVVRAAKACGIAFQWTNVLRDLTEDYLQGRIYIPTVEIKRAGLTENLFGSLVDRKNWDLQKRTAFTNNSEENENLPNRAELERYWRTCEEKLEYLLTQQFERCEIYYTSAAPLYGLINKDSRKVYGMMWDRYYRLYRKLRRNPVKMLRKRIRLSAAQKLRLYLRWKLLPCFRLQ